MELHVKTDLDAFARMMKNPGKYVRVMSANVLNNLAFALKGITAMKIKRSMKIRRPAFVDRMIRVVKAKPGPLDSQVALVGSVRAPGFTGWAENEMGTDSERNRTIMLFARGGDPAKVVVPGMRANAPTVTAESVGIGGTEGNRTIGLLAYMGRTQNKGLFKLEGNQFKGGLYKIIPGQFSKRLGKHNRMYSLPKFKKVQELDKHFHVKRNAWREHSKDALLIGTTMPDEWNKGMRQAIDRMKRVHG